MGIPSAEKRELLRRYKFTGKERDTESGLDMFGARYYASSLGRFTIPDWAAKPTAVPYASFGNPQSLNLYSYVNNNPTTTRDPDGHCVPWCLAVAGGGILADEAPLAFTGPVGWLDWRNCYYSSRGSNL